MTISFAIGAVLAAMAAAWTAGAQGVVVTPRRMALCAGQHQTFQARWADPGRALPAGSRDPDWIWELAEPGMGDLDPATGRYTAPALACVGTARILAVHARDRRIRGEAEVTVLPDAPFQLMDRVQGPGWLEPFAADLPFLDLETGRRLPVPGRVAEDPQRGFTRLFPAAVGRPCRLAWEAPAAAQAQLLSYREGEAVVRRDVTGQGDHEITPWGPVPEAMVEALTAQDPGRGWRSRCQHLAVDVRGVAPFAGNFAADGADSGGHQDGTRTGARFRAPCGLGALSWISPFGEPGWVLLVADPENHVLRRVDGQGRVATLGGVPGRAGHGDSPGLLDRFLAWTGLGSAAPARFNRPTHVVALRCLFGEYPHEPWVAAVSDSGNHAIRAVDPEGQVRTLAGGPGRPGHADHRDPLQARFRDPQGLCLAEARLYVADRGNHVIRVIHPSGQVETVAGQPGRSGTEDGPTGAARFSDLKGIAFAPAGAGQGLLVVDGHAVRRVDLGAGMVTTVLGVPDRPGFQDVLEGGADARARALRQPCLHGPVGILWHRGVVYLADRDNHAVRKADLGWFLLETLAGDPEAGDIRWGLLRDGVPGPLAQGYAAMGCPAGLAAGVEGLPVSLLAATGSGIAELREGGHPRTRLALTVPDLPPAAPGQSMEVRLRAEPLDLPVGPAALSLRASIDFLEPDGSLALGRELDLEPGAWHRVEGAFSQPGLGQVVVRVVTGEGLSAGTRREVMLTGP